MRATFEFEQTDYTLLQMARLLVDLQHLAVFVRAIVEEGPIADFDIFDPAKQSYQYLISADQSVAVGPYGRILNESEVTVVGIEMQSPLKVILHAWSPDSLKRRFHQVAEGVKHLIHHDLQRQKIEFENELLRQKALQESIRTFDAAVATAKKIKDKKLQERFLDHFVNSVSPFVNGTHPPIKSIKIEPD